VDIDELQMKAAEGTEFAAEQVVRVQLESDTTAAATIAAFFFFDDADAPGAAEALVQVMELAIAPLPSSVPSSCEKKKRDLVPYCRSDMIN
jgi:phage terminase Nu1 subunit (DNA packaging protein)